MTKETLLKGTSSSARSVALGYQIELTHTNFSVSVTVESNPIREYLRLGGVVCTTLPDSSYKVIPLRGRITYAPAIINSASTVPYDSRNLRGLPFPSRSNGRPRPDPT